MGLCRSRSRGCLSQEALVLRLLGGLALGSTRFLGAGHGSTSGKALLHLGIGRFWRGFKLGQQLLLSDCRGIATFCKAIVVRVSQRVFLVRFLTERR
jgi:hypothetical protein